MNTDVWGSLDGADNRSVTRDKSCVRVFFYDLRNYLI